MYLYGIEIEDTSDTTSHHERSNCTFMELKSAAHLRPSWCFRVLIVPLWNWNTQQPTPSQMSSSSNCTFMELKFFQHILAIFVAKVLIVPLWNWNEVMKQRRKTIDSVLIVPLWNWNSDKSSWQNSKQASSNCTFMELKFLALSTRLLMRQF